MALSTVIHQAVLSEDSEATELRPLRVVAAIICYHWFRTLAL